MPKKLLSTEEARSYLAKRYENQKQNWLGQAGAWPLSLNLGVPTEKDVVDNFAAVRAWVDGWAQWQGPGVLNWEERQYARMGRQRLPCSLVLDNAAEVAAVVGHARSWATVCARWTRFAERWPVLKDSAALAGRFAALEGYSNADFERLFCLLDWLDRNPASGLYLRQLPIEGLDTKWFEQRTGVVTPLLRALRGVGAEVDFYSLCGLRRPAHRVRVRVLCPLLRAAVGGLQDIEAPASELAVLPLRPTTVVIVENLETGLALPEMVGTVAFMRLGNSVSVLGSIPWLRDVPAVYWGDIDTHGYAILDRARKVLPGVRSVLMDESTLLSHRDMWVTEPQQCADLALEALSPEERRVYQGLRSATWGDRVRLEQERLRLGEALAALRTALA